MAASVSGDRPVRLRPSHRAPFMLTRPEEPYLPGESRHSSPGHRHLAEAVEIAVQLEPQVHEINGQPQPGNPAEQCVVGYLEFRPRQILPDALMRPVTERQVVTR